MFCCHCAYQCELKIPEDDNRERWVCPQCTTTHYENPKIIVGILPYYKNQILLCQRAIEPAYGLWTIPSGFMECNETVEEGAKREAFEEAGIHCQDLNLFVVYSIPHISQVYMVFLSELKSKEFFPGNETLTIDFFDFDRIPWDKIAFSSVTFSLKKFTSHFPIQKSTVFIN